MRTRIAAVVALAALLAAAPAALAHQGNPNYLSQVDAITPATKGVTVDVLNRDDRLLLHNTSGQDVVIRGYNGEPYARVLADGTVQVNRRSPARYLNDDRFAQVSVPAGIDGKGAPRWEEISRTGRFEWHDHRFHWMARDGAAGGARPGRQDEGLRLAHPDRGRRTRRRDRRHALLDASAGRRAAAGRRRRARGAAVRRIPRRVPRAPPAASAGRGVVIRALVLAAVLALGAPAAASAHAVLEGTAPERGATLDRVAARGRAALQRAGRNRVRRGARL